jgi:hypothetical protein
MVDNIRKTIKRIVVFGDSNAFGHGLPDCTSPEGKYFLDKPSKNAFPALIGDHFSIPVINLGVPGAGNDCILRLCYNYLMSIPSIDDPNNFRPFYQDGDLVIIGLSIASRMEIFNGPQSKYEGVLSNFETITQQNELIKSAQYIMSLTTEESLFLDLLRQISILKAVMKGMNAHYLICHLLPPINANYFPDCGNIQRDVIPIIQSYEPQWKRLLDNNYIPYVVHSLAHQNYLPCWHPNEIGHKIIANFLIERINEIPN